MSPGRIATSPLLQLLLLPLLLLLSPSAQAAEAADGSLEAERLNWLKVTPPDQENVVLTCVSGHFYPFKLLQNDTDGHPPGGGRILRLWWLLPDRRAVQPGYDDGNRRLLRNGVEMHFRRASSDVHGLYHCGAEAERESGNGTGLYFYKRALNLYGADVYGGSQWEKYKFNLLTGCLSSGTFLLLLGGWVLLQRLGVCSKISSSAVHAFQPPADAEQQQQQQQQQQQEWGQVEEVAMDESNGVRRKSMEARAVETKA